MEAHLLQVTTDDGECQFWLAAGTEEQAVQLVLDAIPERWAAKLMHGGLTAREEAAALGLIVGLVPGEAREVSRGIGLS